MNYLGLQLTRTQKTNNLDQGMKKDLHIQTAPLIQHPRMDSASVQVGIVELSWVWLNGQRIYTCLF